MRSLWHLLFCDELLITCGAAIASVKINNWIIDTKIQSWVLFHSSKPGGPLPRPALCGSAPPPPCRSLNWEFLGVTCLLSSFRSDLSRIKKQLLLSASFLRTRGCNFYLQGGLHLLGTETVVKSSGSQGSCVHGRGTLWPFLKWPAEPGVGRGCPGRQHPGRALGTGAQLDSRGWSWPRRGMGLASKQLPECRPEAEADQPSPASPGLQLLSEGGVGF